MSFVGFKFGKYDKEKKENIPLENTKFNNKNVRQAFLYAVDRDQINEKIYKGLTLYTNRFSSISTNSRKIKK